MFGLEMDMSPPAQFSPDHQDEFQELCKEYNRRLARLRRPERVVLRALSGDVQDLRDLANWFRRKYNELVVNSWSLREEYFLPVDEEGAEEPQMPRGRNAD